MTEEKTQQTPYFHVSKQQQQKKEVTYSIHIW